MEKAKLKRKIKKLKEKIIDLNKTVELYIDMIVAFEKVAIAYKKENERLNKKIERLEAVERIDSIFKD